MPLVLAVFGGVLGLTFAFLTVPMLLRHLPPDLPRTSEIAVDVRVLLFTSVVSIITGIVFGLVPFFRSQAVSPGDSLKQCERGIATGQSRLRSALIVGQVAIALVVLTPACGP